MRKWLSPGESFAGVAFLAAVMPLTYTGDLQESAPLLMLLFVLGLWAIRQHKILLFELILIVGSITNETQLILIAVFFLPLPLGTSEENQFTNCRRIFHPCRAYHFGCTSPLCNHRLNPLYHAMSTFGQ
jgi:hypothetical protein